ncbi:hypothetical protein FA95DRAFT_405055 [Auriscalpium vulgare]|uniref:Uncharacterized protein n=1 Tax=Auriscalpium vulgare TaxID=40419 RepID=A0ACB8RIF2_9AGAM|nr:hypothetical protein FA95DRAFT_405055 [Auriscalpium vulgare]
MWTAHFSATGALALCTPCEFFCLRTCAHLWPHALPTLALFRGTSTSRACRHLRGSCHWRNDKLCRLLFLDLQSSFIEQRRVTHNPVASLFHQCSKLEASEAVNERFSCRCSRTIASTCLAQAQVSSCEALYPTGRSDRRYSVHRCHEERLGNCRVRRSGISASSGGQWLKLSSLSLSFRLLPSHLL